MYVALRDLDAGVRDPPVEDPRFFVSLISRLVRAAKGIEIELTEADIETESAEFRRAYRKEVQRATALLREEMIPPSWKRAGKRGKRNPRRGR